MMSSCGTAGLTALRIASVVGADTFVTAGVAASHALPSS